MSLFATRSHSLAWIPRTLHLLHAKLFQTAAEASQLCERPLQIAHFKHFRVGEPGHFSTQGPNTSKAATYFIRVKFFVVQGVCQAAAHNYNYYTL